MAVNKNFPIVTFVTVTLEQSKDLRENLQGWITPQVWINFGVPASVEAAGLSDGRAAGAEPEQSRHIAS